MRTLYVNISPKFAISVDQYQWILSTRQTNRGEWTDNSYFPNLSNLLDELAEQQFRSNSKKMQDIKDLEIAIDRVYTLVNSLRDDLEASLCEGVKTKDVPVKLLGTKGKNL